ncbi:TPA: hypothetical protein ACJMGT_002214 [Neisseria meningitidis]
MRQISLTDYFCKGLSLITRIDFNLFCRFDELSIPDYSIVD